MRKINDKSNLAGEIIKKHRKKEGYSRERLAEQLQLRGFNIDRTSIFRIEKSEVILKDFELLAICEILNIDYQELKDELNKQLESSTN